VKVVGLAIARPTTFLKSIIRKYITKLNIEQLYFVQPLSRGGFLGIKSPVQSFALV
jgi:hypothetical protein